MNRREVKGQFCKALEELTGAPIPRKEPAFSEIVNDIVLPGGKFLLSEEALNRAAYNTTYTQIPTQDPCGDRGFCDI